jgi:Zn-dependent peptidase ImmA (M78 family)
VNRSAYYEGLKGRAREIRQEFGLTTARVRLSDMRRVFKRFGIRVDLWPYKLKNLRGAYFSDDLGCSVLLAKGLPDEPRIFTMAHELKHHLEDRQLGRSFCDPSNDSDALEIGAEVFAAELIFPEADFAQAARDQGIEAGKMTPEDLVRLKRATNTTLSYAGLLKRSYRLGLAAVGSLDGVKWKVLEERIYGRPVYKRLLERKRRLGLNARISVHRS